MFSNKSELDEVILIMTQKMNRPKFIEHHLDISDWFEQFMSYPFTEKSVYDFFWVIPC